MLAVPGVPIQKEIGNGLLVLLAKVRATLDLPVSRKTALFLFLGLVTLAYPILRQRSQMAASLGGGSPDQGLGVTELIKRVRDELAASEKDIQTHNEAALFEVKRFDLEISFVVTASSTVQGGFDYKVVTADSHSDTGSQRVQKLTLHFDAIGSKPISKRATVGNAPPGESDLIEIDAVPTKEKKPSKEKKP